MWIFFFHFAFFFLFHSFSFSLLVFCFVFFFFFVFVVRTFAYSHCFKLNKLLCALSPIFGDAICHGDATPAHNANQTETETETETEQSKYECRKIKSNNQRERNIITSTWNRNKYTVRAYNTNTQKAPSNCCTRMQIRVSHHTWAQQNNNNKK